MCRGQLSVLIPQRLPQVTYADEGTYTQKDFWNKEISTVKVAVTREFPGLLVEIRPPQLWFPGSRFPRVNVSCDGVKCALLCPLQPGITM